MNNVVSGSGAGAALGLLCGLGLLAMYAGLPMHRRPTLGDRVLPYLRDAPLPSRLLADQPRGASVPWLVALDPALTGLGRRLARLLGGAASVRRRLVRAGRSSDVGRFRAEQVIWAAMGALGGIGVGTAAWVGHGTSAIVVALMVGLGAVGGALARDHALTRQVVRRERRMLAEFPTVAELLALAVAAGEGAVGALERVCRVSHGELVVELTRCLADARAGASLPDALQGLASRTGLPSLARFVDGMVVAVQRGTPLADVLRAQAQDARDAGRRAVMEAGGRKEIAMMVPVVFLVLPVTVIFAIFPGFALLQFSI